METEFRAKRSESPEGKGIARRAWDAYISKASPAVEPVARMWAASTSVDLMGFWLVWHLHGGYEGLRRLGMSRSAIYRRTRLFRMAVGVHPDEFEMPGVTLDQATYWATPLSKR